VAGTDGNSYTLFQNIQAVRALLDAPWGGPTSLYSDPLVRQTGVPITLTAGTTTSTASLPGPMRWQYAHSTTLSAATHKAVDGPVVVSNVYAVGATGGAVDGIDASSGRPRWVFNPAGGTDYSRASSPAASSGTAYAALAMNRGSDVHGEVYGLKTQPTLTVQLGPAGVNDGCSIQPGSVSVTLANGSGAITPQPDDKADYRGRFITFGAANSGQVAGKAILVTYGLETGAGTGVFTTVTNEPHVVPAIATFAYVPGFIKLKRNPVQNATVSITTPDGTPVAGVAFPETSVSFGGANCVPDGWVDLRAATVTDGAGAHALPPGQEVIVQYTGWNEDLGGWESVPDAGRNVPAERQQVPVYFGPAISSPAVAASSLFVGTEGYRGGGATIISPLDANAWPWPLARNETMLSIDVNPATGAGSGNRVAPVVPESSTYPSTLVPVVSSSPTVSGDNVFVGLRCVLAANPDQLGPSAGKFGFVSALGSRTTLVCDNTRVMEVRQGQPWWVCLGTRSPRADQDPQATGTAGTLTPEAFNRPAKATKLGLDTIIPLGTGNHYLVCDTGNNRVVEIDQLGNIVWPLDVGVKNGTIIPVDYWTSPDYGSANGPNPTKAHLSRPADVWRYVTTWEDFYNNTTGAVGPDGIPEVTWHTVIADAGNARVIDIATVRVPMSATNPMIVQKHRIRVLSPTQARLGSNPSQIARIEYTSAQPIFDPRDSQNCIGYLCTASNLNQLVILDNYSRILNPVRSLNIWHNTYGTNGVGTPSRDASATWQYWCWLYTIYDNATASWVMNPLIFSNIRHAEYSTVGTRQYVTVAASHYLGRLNALTPAPLTAATSGAGVFDFAMNVDPSDNSGNSWARVAPTTPSPDDPVWYFNQNDYVNPNTAYRMAYFTLASGQTINKVLDPWCAKRLPDGRHLITTMAPLVEHFTHQNAPGLSGTSLGSEVFEVVTRITDGLGNLVPPGAGDLDPTLYQKYVDARSIVPDPRAVDWADPLSQPAYAERY
jgi:hypothetical protein